MQDSVLMDYYINIKKAPYSNDTVSSEFTYVCFLYHLHLCYFRLMIKKCFLGMMGKIEILLGNDNCPYKFSVMLY